VSDDPLARRPLWLAALAALALASVLAHASTLGNGFIDLDDRALVDWVRSHPFRDFVREAPFFNYVPVTLASLGLESRLVGDAPFLYHLDNVLLHAVAAVGTALVLRALRQPAWVSLLVAALFALHPMRVESVAWIAERKALLAAVFSLASLRAWIAWSDARRPLAYGAALLGFALALGSKPSVVGLPLLLAAIDWHRGRGLGPRTWPDKLPFLALALAAGLVSLAVQQAEGPSVNAALSLPERIAGAGEALAFYVARSLWPVGLSGYYEVGAALLPLHDAALAALVAGALHLWLWRRPEHRADALLGAAWFALFVAPTLRLVSFGGLSFYSDRYVYQACVGLWLILTLPLRPLAEARPALRRAAVAAAAVVLTGLAVGSALRGPVWRDAESFWSDVLAKVPGSSLPHLQLGGRRAASGDHAAAIEHFRAAVAAQPICGPCYYAMARSHQALGEHAAAADAIGRAVEASPENLPTLVGAARFHLARGRPERARPLLERATALEPTPGAAHGMLARLALDEGAVDEARRLLEALREAGSTADPALLRRAGLTGEAARPALDVVIVTVDTLRRDHVSAYAGDEGPVRTPAFDALARQGLVHRAAYTPMPTTGPAHVSLLTGLAPAEHGARRNGRPMRDEAREHELGRRLGAAGYATGAFVTSQVVSPAWTGLAGFEVFDVPSERLRAAPEAVDAALAWLGRLPEGRPVFLWVHFFDPHTPYGTPAQKRAGLPVDLAAHGFIEDDRYAEPAARRAVEARYRAGVTSADAAFGRLRVGIEQVRGRRPLWILTADHGESFDEHLAERGFAYDHGEFLDPEVLAVPLVVAGPGVEPGRSEGAVSLRDVHPTVLAATGLAPLPAGARDLRVPDARRRVVTSTRREFASEMPAAVRTHAAAATDGRSRVVVGEDGSPTVRAGGAADLLSAARRALGPAAPSAPALDPATRDALRELGYLE